MKKTLLITLLLIIIAGSQSKAQQETMLIIGDSLTSGLYASSDETAFRNLVADDLGYDLTWCFGSKLPHVLSCWFTHIGNYDVCVIENGLNDVSRPLWNEATYKQEYHLLVANMKQYCGRVIVATMFAGTDETNENYDKYIRYNEIIRTSGGEVADLWNATKDCPATCKSNIDWFHPNDTGHRKIADVIIWRILADDMYLPIIKNTAELAYP